MPLLALDGVRKSYWRGRHEIRVLDDVSLELEGGEFVALFGDRASGKTTLLRLACGIEAPDAGAVRFEGRDLATLRRPPRIAGVSKRIGWVRRAGPSISAMQMLDYVALALLGDVHHREAHRRASRALTDVGGRDLATATWGELSDAERTLVSIAQATAHEPLLLLADDPTVSLGVGERETVLALLRTAAERGGMAVLMTVPDVPEMLRAHTVMTLSDGELIRPTRQGADVIQFPRGQGGAG
jgi:ABC-type lipoprotein export system ATPase subunit